MYRLHLLKVSSSYPRYGWKLFANRFLDFISEELTSKGWAFLAPNTRGNDAITDIPVAGPDEKYERIGSYRELFEDCIKDIKTWIDLAESRGYTEIVLQGHSLQPKAVTISRRLKTIV